MNWPDPKVNEQWSGFDALIGDVLDKLGPGYLQTWYYDCAWIDTNKPTIISTDVCQRSASDFVPQFVLLRPPFSRRNPYSGQNLLSDIVSFPENHVEPKNLKKWILDNIPDYSNRAVSSVGDLDSFLDTRKAEISKLIFLSGKQKAPQSVGALSATFRDRIHFAFVND